jgi:hypothetical protein
MTEQTYTDPCNSVTNVREMRVEVITLVANKPIKQQLISLFIKQLKTIYSIYKFYFRPAVSITMPTSSNIWAVL